jgi:hypothetical protein
MLALNLKLPAPAGLMLMLFVFMKHRARALGAFGCFLGNGKAAFALGSWVWV